MLRLSLADLPSLLECDSEACVSIYLSRPVNGSASEGFKGHYRALVKRAESVLGSNARLQTKTRLLNNLRGFGSYILEKGHDLPHGVALFASPSFLGWFPLPVRTRGAVFVSNSFHIRPLLPYLNPASRWHALIIGDDSSMLFRCAADAGELIARCSTGANRLRTKSTAAGKLERWVFERLAHPGAAPLVVAAPDDVKVDLDGLEAASILSTPFVGTDGATRGDSLAPTQLWPRVKLHLLTRTDAILTDLRKEYARGRATTRPEEVVARLRNGGIRALAISDGGNVRGRVDWRAGALCREAASSGYGDCVLDDIVERALREHCRIVHTDATCLPPGALLLAV